jgi:hypothetical protein
MGPEEHSPPDTTANRAPYERIVELVCDHMGIKSHTVGLRTSLQRIGTDGDDAVAFMSRFAEEFRVDMKNCTPKKLPLCVVIPATRKPGRIVCHVGGNADTCPAAAGEKAKPSMKRMIVRMVTDFIGRLPS